MNKDDLVLGVDGGGSKTVCWLARVDRQQGNEVIGRGVTGTANMQAAGVETAFRNLQQAIAAAFTDAGLERCRVRGACLGLAGVDRMQELTLVQAWAKQSRLADRVRVVNDALLALYAGTRDGIGVALIAGTGSIAVGRNTTGEIARSGGWGYLLGDEGSGFAIASAGLQAATRYADGRGATTVLLPRFLKHLDVREPSELIAKVYGAADSRRLIAESSPVVFEASEVGDETASKIVHAAAADLAGMVFAVASRLKLSRRELPLSFAGSVLVHQEMLRRSVLEAVVSAGYSDVQANVVSDPVAGALRLATTEVVDEP